MEAAAALIEGLQFYAMVGVGVAALFIAFGLEQVDASSRGSWAFRPLILPGLILLWPLVLLRWLALARGN